MSDVTHLLNAIEQDDPHAAAQLLPLVYAELRRLAAQKLAQEKPGQTLQATALVHEAYLRLVGTNPAQPWDSRGHFFAAAAEAMRRILIDQARRKRSRKHGADRCRLDLDAVAVAASEPDEDLLALDAALKREDWPAARAARDRAHDLLRRELLEHTLAELKGNAAEAARRLGIPPEGLRAWMQQLQPEGAAPEKATESEPGEKGERKNLRRARAMTVILAHPDWTVERIARELGCSPQRSGAIPSSAGFSRAGPAAATCPMALRLPAATSKPTSDASWLTPVGRSRF
jgi:RNA polymerase sigma factor (TIGR02999 family)